MINVNDIKEGDIFSENSHYVCKKVSSDSIQFVHSESKKQVVLDKLYVASLLMTADQYDSEVKVTKEDKKDGTAGIRSIWQGIHSTQVFTVCFKKQDTAHSKKELKRLQDEQIAKSLAAVEKAQVSKKGVLEAAKKALAEIQSQPILPYVPGEQRTLRGYKVQFLSNDGKYDVFDMDINDLRQVNINTIQWLVYNNVKYIVQ